MKLRNFGEGLNFGLCNVLVTEELSSCLRCSLCEFTTPSMAVFSCDHSFCEGCLTLSSENISSKTCGVCLKTCLPQRIVVDEKYLVIRTVKCACGQELKLKDLKAHCATCAQSNSVFKTLHEKPKKFSIDKQTSGTSKGSTTTTEVDDLKKLIEEQAQELRLFKKRVKDEVRLLAAKTSSEVEPRLEESQRSHDELFQKVLSLTVKVRQLVNENEALDERLVEKVAPLQTDLAECRAKVAQLETKTVEHTLNLNRQNQSIQGLVNLPAQFEAVRLNAQTVGAAFDEHLENETNAMTVVKNEVLQQLGGSRYYCYFADVSKKYNDWRGAHFSKMDFFSDAFQLDGYTFRLNVSFSIEGGRSFLGLFIKPLPPTHSTKYLSWPMKKLFQLTVHSHVDPNQFVTQDFSTFTEGGEFKQPFIFPNGESWGFKQFTDLTQAMAENGFLRRDTFLVSAMMSNP